MSDLHHLHDAISKRVFAEDPTLFNRIISRFYDKAIGDMSGHMPQTVLNQEEIVVPLYACLPEATGDYVMKPWHLSLFALSLVIGWLDIASRLSNVCWKSIDKSVDVDSLLNYYLNSSLLHLSAGMNEEAFGPLHLALCIPGTAPSVIQIAAMRKLCFLQLIYHGDLIALPTWVSKSHRTVAMLWDALRDHPGAQDHAMKHLGSLASTYRDLLLPSDLKSIVKAFRYNQGDTTDLDAALNLLKPKLIESGDWSLAELLPIAMKRRTLEQISLTYAAVKTELVGRRCFCESVSDISRLVDDFNSYENKNGTKADIDSTGEYILFTSTSDPTDGVIQTQNNRLQTIMTSVVSSFS